MKEQNNYKKTLIACYLGFITQAIASNFPPLLFLTFKNVYGIPLKYIALIPMLFYLTQLLTDLAATKFVDIIGYRICVVSSQLLSAIGLASMAILPNIIPIPFLGLLISVILYAIGSGLIEVLVSPIVEACPFKNKEKAMSLLHSFYCWGAVIVILGSTLFFTIIGIENWQILTLIWALIPLYNAFKFLRCPINRLIEDGESLKISKLMRLPIFWILILLMICSGASEATMAQWASAFTESALGVSKTIGDLTGPCLFAVFMGISRLLYGIFSKKLNLSKAMLISGILCVACYFIASLSPYPILSLFGCAFCGLAVGIMWPGTISLASQKCTRGGTAMFALLALAGDLGATLSPALAGSFENLKTGLFVTSAFPILLVAGLIIFRMVTRTRNKIHQHNP